MEDSISHGMRSLFFVLKQGDTGGQDTIWSYVWGGYVWLISGDGLEGTEGM